MADVLFISTNTLKKFTVIDGSTDADMITQYIFIAQEVKITNYLGTDLITRLKAGVTADDLTANEVILIDTYIVPALIHWSAAEYFSFARFNAAQGGIFQHQQDNAVIMTKEDVDSLVAKETSLAEYYTTRLINYLCENSSLYPEYSTNTGDDINPDKTVNYASSWYMGGVKGKYPQNDWRIDEV